MTDLETMEAAARAAGIYYWIEEGTIYTHGDAPGSSREWNPREDDGDAFRLGVALNLFEEHPGFIHERAVQMNSGKDPIAATRIAVTVVAAGTGGKK